MYMYMHSNLKCHPDGVPSLPDLHGLHHTSVPQLSQNQLLVKLAGSFAVVGLDTAHEVRVGLLQSLHQSNER